MNPTDLSLQMVTVRQSDIDRMLKSYDSGMFDVTTSNAVALALRRLLKPGHRIRVVRDTGRQHGAVLVDDRKFDLPPELLKWLAKAERARPVEPISFRAALPNDWLIQPINPSERPPAPATAEMSNVA